MPDIKQFFAAELVDVTCQVHFPLFCVDMSTPETLRNSVEAIVCSKYTPDQVKGMLGVVKANAQDMFSEDEKASIFEGVESSETSPFAIQLSADNYPLLYEALDQMSKRAATASEEGNSEEDKTLQSKLDEALASIETVTAEKEELSGKVASLANELEKVRGDLAAAEELMSSNDLAGEVQSLKETLVAKETAVNLLTDKLAALTASVHESLAKEAAHLAVQLNKAVASNKSFEELLAFYAARTDESLTDTVSDFTLEVGTVDGTGILNESLKVANPTLVEENIETDVQAAGKTIADVKEVAEQLYTSITHEEEETYLISGITQEELAQIKSQTSV